MHGATRTTVTTAIPRAGTITSRTCTATTTRVRAAGREGSQLFALTQSSPNPLSTASGGSIG